ncbi:hypothetical protein GCM10028826_17530 [Mucilaginibacter boryungensis]|uniref:Helix-turn-helix transcriptional regulator n=2 Tax=Mucilaginibacter boryungensis TaxID=768480 RepID=A0ABR9XMV4_9SPHI|nr:helix-turn-helix transcriptional regulator [Mucilaginibacter boryungensis]
MVLLPFYTYRKIAQKPHTTAYALNPQTLGEHIKKKRIENDELQKDVALVIGVSEDTITYWENDRTQPQVCYYPNIIAYLGNYPFVHDVDTIAGKIIKMRYCNGWTREYLAEMVGVNTSTITRWETTTCTISPKKLKVLKGIINRFL